MRAVDFIDLEISANSTRKFGQLSHAEIHWLWATVAGCYQHCTSLLDDLHTSTAVYRNPLSVKSSTASVRDKLTDLAKSIVLTTGVTIAITPESS